jgi:hypothetical protein
MRTVILPALAFLALSPIGWAFQPGATTTANPPDGFADIVNRIKAARAANSSPRIAEIVRDLAVTGALAAHEVPSVLTDTERLRIDKQPAPAGAAGTTSLVGRGTVPFLLGVAIENGAVTRTTSGTSITFTTRAAGFASFLLNNSFTSGAITSSSGLGAQLLNKTTLSVTYDVSRGNSDQIFTGTRNQVSGFSAHVDLFNRRDARDPRYVRHWIKLTRSFGVADSDAATHLRAIAGADTEIANWITETTNTLAASSAEQVATITNAAMDTLVTKILPRRLAANSALRSAYDDAAGKAENFAFARRALVEKILRSPTVAVEYQLVRQTPPIGTDSTATTAAGASLTSLPDLGSLRLIASTGIGKLSNLTINAGVTTFNNTFRQDRIRDYRLGLQLDMPVLEIKDWGNVSFSLSGLFLKLRQQPLGETVKINGVVLNSIGNTGFAQAKLEVPFGSSGVRLPFAVTWASRHELLANEKNLFGANIGLTFDLDKLMASRSAK